MNFKVLTTLCLFLVCHVVLAGKIKKNDEYEDVYGELEDSSAGVQKDGTIDYYDGGDTDNQENDTGEEQEIDAKLLSKPETFVQKIGDVVYLPCQVSSTNDDPVRVWTKNNRQILFQGTINLSPKNNVKLEENGTLVVKVESEEDFGQYGCKLVLSKTSKPEIIHNIVTKMDPSITALYATNHKTVFSLGDFLTLTCEANGYPKPRISWHRGGKRLGTEGETLTIESLRASDADTYSCFADNDGKPAHQHIEIHVEHPPIVSVEKFIVNSDHKSDAELVCVVKAYPTPVVVWQKDGQNIVTKQNKIELIRQNNNERNILTIRDINEDDFGIYSCAAQNTLGKQSRNISLVKIPVVRRLEKSSNESTKDIILQWKVESRQPISVHELQYRRKGETAWKTITPAVTGGENDIYLIKHTLKGLEPGVYETRARSKNNHGWSEYSEVMPFEGNPAHNTPAQQRSEGHVGESTSSSTPNESSICLLIIALSLTYLHVRQ